MPRGGPRPNSGGARKGAGRKPNAATKKTSEIAVRSAAEGITPIEVMLAIMRACYAGGDFLKAADIARDAAPYTTPRLSAVAVKNVNELPPNFNFLIETVDERGNLLAAPAPAPTPSGANGVSAEQGSV